MATKAVTIFVNSDDHRVERWADYSTLYSLPTYQTAATTASEADVANQIEEKLGYRFKYPKLLRSAFMHPSYPSQWANVPCYQRLEFLGDSLLDMACVNHLFTKYPDKDPQWLTEHKVSPIFPLQTNLCCTDVIRWQWYPTNSLALSPLASIFMCILSISATCFKAK